MLQAKSQPIEIVYNKQKVVVSRNFYNLLFLYMFHGVNRNI